MEKSALYEKLDLALQGKLKQASSQKTCWNWAIQDTDDVGTFYQQVPKSEWPMEYDFDPDDFQKRAFLRITQGKHVFVSAHTSAGKTVTAEWAIAQSLTHGAKAIYTSPIKALSNQKFRDFKVKFNHIEVQEYDNYNDGYFSEDDGYIYDFQSYQNCAESGDDRVGIITGDVQMNQDAPCLVMTTEILRTMIYDNDKILQELEWVVFDEIHYMNDPERGRVWEEVISLLPGHVNMLFLSATTPNAMEFSEWVGREKGRNVYVISTPKRPIPLEHYLHVGTYDTDLKQYYQTDEEMRTAYLDSLDPQKVDMLEEVKKVEKMTFRTAKLKETIDLQLSEGDGMYQVVDQSGCFQEEADIAVKKFCSEKRGDNHCKSALSWSQSRHHWITLFKLLHIKKKFPAVVFVFSKKRAVALTEYLESEDYTTKREKSRIKVFVKQCLDRLKPADRELVQIQFTVSLLERGIAVHHGGLLPLLKEMTEILFQRGYIRILFATETFAMGINMPTRCVVFSGVSKHDGNDFRNLLPGEYTQMSGRAGRRGLDKVGTVIVLNWKPSQVDYKKMISGKPLTLVSQFRLTYQTILVMFRSQGLDKGITELLRSSFSEFHSQNSLGSMYQINQCIREGKAYLEKLSKQCTTEHWSLACSLWEQVITCQESMNLSIDEIYTNRGSQRWFAKDRLILVAPEKGLYPSLMKICTAEDAYLTAVYSSSVEPQEPIQIQYDWILAFCDSVVSGQSGEITQVKIPNTKKCRFGFETTSRLLNIKHILDTMYSGQLLDVSDEDAKIVREAIWIRKQLSQLQFKVSEEALGLFPDYNARVELLTNIGYVNDGVLSLKGKIASRINTCHELILTEYLLTHGVHHLTPPQCASLISCLVAGQSCGGSRDKTWSQQLGEESVIHLKEVDEKLYTEVKKLTQILTDLVKQQQQHGIQIDPDKWVAENFNCSLGCLVYKWAQGEDFVSVMRETEVMEGNVVRVIMRLEELCQEIGRTAQVIGDTSIIDKMQEVSAVLKRDIVFCGSLYV